MTCNRNCDCVGECKAGNEKPTTPTPGDLSARLPSIDSLMAKLGTDDPVFAQWRDTVPDKHWATKDLSALYIGYELGKSIAALSALPAAGGAKWTYCPECGSGEVRHAEGDHKQCARCHQEWFADLDYSDVVQKNLARLTTPQPSAAEDYESWAKQERQREDTATRLGSAAVGAQGDGWLVVEAWVHGGKTAELKLQRAFRGDDESVVLDLSGQRISFASATPAAGKGVDEVLAKLHGLARSINNEDVCHLNASADMLAILQEARFGRNRLEAALTRQPVAGESHCVACGESQCRGIVFCDPAATPTDGGEGS